MTSQSLRNKQQSAPRNCGTLLLFIIPNPDIMPWLRKRIPRDVEPAGGGQELVGVRAGAKKVDKTLELLGVARADVGSLCTEG